MKILRTLARHRKSIAKYAKRYLVTGAAIGLVGTQVEGMEPDCPTDWLRYMSMWPAVVPVMVIALAFTFLPDSALDMIFGKPRGTDVDTTVDPHIAVWTSSR